MKYLMPLLLVAASCATPPPKNSKMSKVDVEIRNYTDHDLVLRAQMGFLGRSIRLKPGHSWKGWVPPDFPIKKIQIDVREKKKKPSLP